jgi:hypothetical protein
MSKERDHMSKNLRNALFLFSVILAMTTLGGARASAQAVTEQTKPPPPSWVDASGKVNLDAAPRDLPVVGRDGKVLKNADGSYKMVPSHIGEAPPLPMRPPAVR